MVSVRTRSAHEMSLTDEGGWPGLGKRRPREEPKGERGGGNSDSQGFSPSPTQQDLQ